MLERKQLHDDIIGLGMAANLFLQHIIEGINKLNKSGRFPGQDLLRLKEALGDTRNRAGVAIDNSDENAVSELTNALAACITLSNEVLPSYGIQPFATNVNAALEHAQKNLEVEMAAADQKATEGDDAVTALQLLIDRDSIFGQNKKRAEDLLKSLNMRKSFLERLNACGTEVQEVAALEKEFAEFFFDGDAVQYEEYIASHSPAYAELGELDSRKLVLRIGVSFEFLVLTQKCLELYNEIIQNRSIS